MKNNSDLEYICKEFDNGKLVILELTHTFYNSAVIEQVYENGVLSLNKTTYACNNPKYFEQLKTEYGLNK